MLVIIPHDGDDDAVAIANDSPYGLSMITSGDQSGPRGPPDPHRHARHQRRRGTAPTHRSAATRAPGSAASAVSRASRSSPRPRPWAGLRVFDGRAAMTSEDPGSRRSDPRRDQGRRARQLDVRALGGHRPGRLGCRRRQGRAPRDRRSPTRARHVGAAAGRRQRHRLHDGAAEPRKRSVAIDIAKPDGHEAFMRLIEGADVYLTNYLPQVRRKLRVDVERRPARNPQLVVARGSGQGARGLDAEKAGPTPPRSGPAAWPRSCPRTRRAGRRANPRRPSGTSWAASRPPVRSGGVAPAGAHR